MHGKQMPEAESAGNKRSDLIIVVAMALVSSGIAVSLYAEAGIGLFAALLSGFTIFSLMCFVHLAVTRAQRADAAVQRFHKAEKQIAKLAERVTACEGALQDAQQYSDAAKQFKKLAALPGSEYADVNDQESETLRAGVAIEVNELREQLNVLQNDFVRESEEQKGQIRTEMQVIETLVKQLAEQLASKANREAQQIAATMQAERSQAAAMPKEESSHPPTKEERADIADETSFLIDSFDVVDMDAQMLDVIRQSIENNKIDLYLQSIVDLPHRHDRYYEALTRLRNVTDEIILPENYIRVAEQAGIMPIIDNVMLFRSIKVVNRLANAPGSKALFCNISPHSLWDPEFFPEFISFMKQNKHLAGHLVFEFSQLMLKQCGPVELESLKALSALGFRLSLDQVHELNINYQTLQDRGFRFIKISADILLHRLEETGGRIHAADMRNYIGRYGIELIVEKIEDERTLSRVIECNIALGQGYLFSEPRLVRSEIYTAKKDRTTAA